jgi:hypothetical protein
MCGGDVFVMVNNTADLKKKLYIQQSSERKGR